MGETLVRPIGDRAIVVERSVHVVDRIDQVIETVHVEEGLLLACEETRRAGLRPSRTSAPPNVASLAFFSVGFFIFPSSPISLSSAPGKGLPIQYPFSPFLAAAGEGFHVLGSRVSQAIGDAHPSLAVGTDRRREPSSRTRRARSRPRRGELADHFAERGALSADSGRTSLMRYTNHDEERSRSALVRVIRFVRPWKTRYFTGGSPSLTAMATPKRVAYFISDRTGITAEMLGHSLLTQFESVRFQEVTLPFVDTIDKAHEMVTRINEPPYRRGSPIVISTLVNTEIAEIVGKANALFLDCFEIFISPLEKELGVPASTRSGAVTA